MAPNWFIALPVQVNGMPPLDPPSRVRIFAPEDLHMTVAFLGGVGEKAALQAWARVPELVSSPPVVGSFASVRPLGSPRRPSAISAMVEEGHPALARVIALLRDPLLVAAGAPEDTRPPLPHMTLGRIQRRASATERTEALGWAKGIQLSGVGFVVDAIALYTWSEDRQSRLFRVVERHALT